MAGNLRGPFKSLRVSPGQLGGRPAPLLEKQPPPIPHSLSGLVSPWWGGGGPAAIAGCPPSQVLQGLAPSSRGVRLTPRHSEPREDGGLGPQCSAFSFTRSGVRAEPQHPGLGQGLWKGLREAEGKAMGFGTQRRQSHEEAPSPEARALL